MSRGERRPSFLALLILSVGMSLGPPTALNQNSNLLANPHLARKVGDFKVKTAANVRTHRLVTFDTTDDEIKVCGDAGIAIGWVQYRVKDSEHLTAADFAVGDILKVEKGATRVALYASGSAAVVPGELVCPAAAGMVRKAVLATLADVQSAVGRAGESTNPAAADTVGSVEAF